VAARRPRRLVAAAGFAIVVAAFGRARHRGRLVFDRLSPLLAPLWVAERAILSWVALARRLLGLGCPYAGTVISRAATPPRLLRKRLRSRLGG
jgi:hypothetical protein